MLWALWGLRIDDGSDREYNLTLPSLQRNNSNLYSLSDGVGSPWRRNLWEGVRWRRGTGSVGLQAHAWPLGPHMSLLCLGHDQPEA